MNIISILDNPQRLTYEQCKLIVDKISDSTKVVIIGDIKKTPIE